MRSFRIRTVRLFQRTQTCRPRYFWRYRVEGLLDFNMSISRYLASAFFVVGKTLRWQRAECLLLYLFKVIADMAFGSSVNASICNGGFPVLEEFILCSQRIEFSSLDCTVLYIANTSLDFAFVAWCSWLGCRENEAIVLAEVEYLGM